MLSTLISLWDHHYSAIIATFALLLGIFNFCWDKYKWRQQTTSQLGGWAFHGMKPDDGIVTLRGVVKGEQYEVRYLKFMISNIGSKKTTVTSIQIGFFKSRFRFKQSKFDLMNLLKCEGDFPFVLDSGEVRKLEMEQNPELDERLAKYQSYIAVYDSVSNNNPTLIPIQNGPDKAEIALRIYTRQ